MYIHLRVLSSVRGYMSICVYNTYIYAYISTCICAVDIHAHIYTVTRHNSCVRNHFLRILIKPLAHALELTEHGCWATVIC